MTDRRRLCVVHMPSEQEFAWRRALTDAAFKLGWDAWEYVAGQESPLDPEKDAIIHCSDARDVASFAPTESVIVAATPAEGTGTLMSRFGIDELAALRSTARVFAFASDMAASGTPVVSALNATALFPILGEVARETSNTAASVTVALGDPLAMFDNLPASVGAQAAWRPALFQWAAGDEPGVADLTGRMRILQHGPYLDLGSGEWTIEVVFSVSLHRAKVDLRFEWGTGVDAQSSAHTFDQSGRYSITLTKQWLVPAVGELRIWLDRAMFDGGLEIEGCVVTRTG